MNHAKDKSNYPQITSLTFSPDTINTNNSSSLVLTTITIIDNVNRLSYCSIVWINESSSFGYSYDIYLSLFPPVDTTLVFEVEFEKGSEIGIWTINSIYFSGDSNAHDYNTYELNASGFPVNLVNTNNTSYSMQLTTKSPGDITQSSAYLRGSLELYGGYYNLKLCHQYGENSNVAEHIRCSGTSFNGNIVITSMVFSNLVDNLYPSTTYSYRAVGRNNVGDIQYYGNILTFETDSIIYGCHDLIACNFNDEANTDDGSCTYSEENYDCDGNCTALDECDVCGGTGVDADNDGVCDDVEIVGCNSDTTACNYNSSATDFVDCIYPEQYYNCDGECIVDTDGDGVCDENELSINDKLIPVDYNINTIYPNPFNPLTTISFSIPQSGLVSLKVYDITGRVTSTLKDEYMSVGYYDISWDASSSPSGIYFVKMISDGFIQTEKVVLVK